MPPNPLLPLSVYGRENFVGCLCNLAPALRLHAHETFRGFSGGTTEPDVGRVAHGIPCRVDRLRALGNAVVPQVSQHIGELVMAAA